MVALSPRFTLLATLCALAALSSAPISDAAVLRLRAPDLASNYAYSGASTLLSRRSSYVVGDSPVLPLPKGLVGSQNKSADSSGGLSSSPSGGEPHGDKDVSAGHDTEESTDDDSTAVHNKGGEVKVKVRISRSRVYCFGLFSFIRVGSPLEPVPPYETTE